MTTTNVTDATLKGSVAGPTFTGNVDGAKFTGSVTYTDSQPIPPDPVPPDTGGPTGGRITNFTATPNGELQIDGHAFSVWNAGRDYCLKKLDDYTLRFELHPGDHMSWDGSNVDRSQVDGYHTPFANDNVIKTAFRITIEPGTANNANWFVVGELHNDDKEGGVSTSPPVAVELKGERFRIVARNCRPGGNPSNNGPDLRMLTPWTQPANFVRGQEYVFELEFKLNQASGYLRVKFNGEQVVNYSGPLGYGNHTYWMNGPYRDAASGKINFACKIKNITIGYP